MKSRILKTSIGSIVFLVLVVAVVAVIHPVYEKINLFLANEETKLCRKFEEATGLKLEYENLSPSVLSGIHIRKIIVSDAKNGNQILKIDRASVSYNFADFFSKEPLQAVKLLLLDGVTVEINRVHDSELLSRLNGLLNSSSGSKKEKSKEKKQTGTKSVSIPFDVQLKNLSLVFGDENWTFKTVLNSIFLESNFRRENGIGIKSSGRVEFSTPLLKTENRPSVFASVFSVSGTLFENFDGSSFMLRFFDAEQADFTLSRGDLFVNYDDSKITLRSMKNPLPYNFFVEGDLKNSLVKFSASSENLPPLEIVKIKRSLPLAKKISRSRLSGGISGEFSFSDEKRFLETLKVAADGKFALPKELFNSPVELLWNFSFDEKNLRVGNFSAYGEIVDASFSGNYDFEKRQPSGVFSLNNLRLGNGGVVQTEVFVDSYKDGVLLFAPQFFMDDRSLTALQFVALPSQKSWDWTFEFDDYSHFEYETSGHVKIDGSYIFGNENVVQASVSMSDMFLDSVLKTSAFFMEDDVRSGVFSAADNFENFIFTNEIYFTTDFKTFAFNAPFFILANTQKERQLVTFSLDGSNEMISLSSLNVQFGENTASASCGIDFSGDSGDFSFFSNLVVNSVPYNFSGSYSSKFLSVTGDYDFSAAVSFAKEIVGSLHFAAFPLSAGKSVFSLSADSTFKLNDVGPEIEIQNFEFESMLSQSSLRPRFAFTGTANKYGIVFDRLAYSDSISALEGGGSFSLGMYQGILDSAAVDLRAKSIIGGENITLSAELRNPERKALNGENVRNDFYFSALGNVTRFPFARILSDQAGDNVLNCEFSASGTLANPLVSLSVAHSSVNVAGFPAVFSGSALYDDSGLSIPDFDAAWGAVSVSEITGVFNPQNFEGEFSALIKGGFLETDFNIPLEISVKSLSPDSDKSGNFIAAVSSPKMTGSLFPTGAKLDLVATKILNKIEIVSDSGKGFFLSFSDDGSVYGRGGASSPLKFELNGSVVHNQIDLALTNLKSDLRELSDFIAIPYVDFEKGDFSGAVRISGITTDPDFTGAVAIQNAEFTVPFVSKKMFKADKVFATAGQSHFGVSPTKCFLDKRPFTISLDIQFDRWKMDYLDCVIDTDKGMFVPVDMVFPFVRYRGDAGFENFLIHTTTGECELTGKIIGEKSELIVNLNESQSEAEDPMAFLVDVNFLIKNRVQLLYNPLLRAVIVPDTAVNFYMDTRTNDFVVTGDVALRGGEVVWLNRSFYMKEGKVVLNESSSNFDPLITVRAETKERDDRNDFVTIILEAQSQPLSRFNPRISSTPAKSEKEIMELLGNVITGDADGALSFAMAGGDYIIQTTVMRGIENTLRELCNFDIFSVRTSFLQNAVKYNFDDNRPNGNITFRNYFDNSAVYIGKYLGSAIYVDAMMHFGFDENSKSVDLSSVIFKPSFGIEMESPFVNIRLGIEPDIKSFVQNKNRLNSTSFIPSASFTLSKKFVF